MDYMQGRVVRVRVNNPKGRFLGRWNLAFLVLCSFCLLLDPLFLYVPGIHHHKRCLTVDKKLERAAIILRSSTDSLFIIHIAFQFCTGLVPSSRFSSNNPWEIARKYLSSYFLIDILAILPIPQVAASIMGGSRISQTKDVMKTIISVQFLPRFLRIYQLYEATIRTSHAVRKTVQTRASITIFLYILAGHVVGAFWYLCSIEREMTCWLEACEDKAGCQKSRFYCDEYKGNENDSSLREFLSTRCKIDPEERSPFNFGMYYDALETGVRVPELERFSEKFFYCFWWSLQNLSTLGQNLKTSTYVGEICFAICIFISGLVLFSFVIGIIQTTMLSSTVRLEEMKMKWQDVEEWMSCHFLPDDLRKRIRRHEEYKWQNTKGADVENLLQDLPKYLRKDVKRHLCLDQLTRVTLFEKMDKHLLDEIFDCLKPVLYTEKSYIIREGDPIDEMLFIMQGELSSMTVHDGLNNDHFNNSIKLKAGDFCGEELLTWAIDSNSSPYLPHSTRTVQAQTEVEAFALMAEDLKSVVSKFMELHCNQFHHLIRYFSWQWRTWAAYYIQDAWHRYKERKMKRLGKRPCIGWTQA